jgi:hypothetical protein
VHPSKRKGVEAEREVAAILTDLLGLKVVRRHNIGTHEDIGDLILENTTIQVTARADLAAAIRVKLPETVAQQTRAGALFGALFARRRGGSYVVCMTPEQFATLWREAQPVPDTTNGPPPPPIWLEPDEEERGG